MLRGCNSRTQGHTGLLSVSSVESQWFDKPVSVLVTFLPGYWIFECNCTRSRVNEFGTEVNQMHETHFDLERHSTQDCRPGDFDTNQWSSFLRSKKGFRHSGSPAFFFDEIHSALYRNSRNSGPSLICSYVTRRLVSLLYRS